MSDNENILIPLLEKVLDTVPVGVVAVDAEGRIVYLNGAYERILGVRRQKVLGRLIRDIEPEATLLEVLESGQEVREKIVLIRSIDRHVKVNILPLHEEKHLLGAVSFFEDVTESQELSQELVRVTELAAHFRQELETQRELPGSFSELEGRDQAFMEVLGKAAIVSDTDAPVLLLGENGTGKEVLARAIHAASRRSHKPFIAVNCAAVPETLLESELFGYEEGSFTGARKGGKMGKFELAEGGTLFLDETGDMPGSMQSKLLRVLQEKEIEKIGRMGTISVDVRIIAATNKDLGKLAAAGGFRADLYYRLNVVSITLPPLRQRGKDVLLLASNMLKKLNVRYGKELSLSQEVQESLYRHDWPGNVRELLNCLEHAVIMCERGLIGNRHLPLTVRSRTAADSQSSPSESLCSPAVLAVPDASAPSLPWHLALADVEKRLLSDALTACNGNRSAAMRALKVSRRTFYKKLREYGMIEA